MSEQEAVEEAARGVEAKFPGSHVVCLSLSPSGHVAVFAKSDDINDVPALLRALRWFARMIRARGKVVAAAPPGGQGEPASNPKGPTP